MHISCLFPFCFWIFLYYSSPIFLFLIFHFSFFISDHSNYFYKNCFLPVLLFNFIVCCIVYLYVRCIIHCLFHCSLPFLICSLSMLLFEDVFTVLLPTFKCAPLLSLARASWLLSGFMQRYQSIHE